MSQLTEDEHACLMIMAEGQNLIAMQNTRWYAPLMSLHAKDFCKSIGNNNYVITQRGRAALAGHEESLDGDLRKAITAHGKIQQNRRAVHAKMQVALGAIIDAARMSALTTGSSEITCCDQILAELVARAREQLR
jgi:hypothetical protein